MQHVRNSTARNCCTGSVLKVLQVGGSAVPVCCCADHALILDSGEPRLLAFVEEMRRRLRVRPFCGTCLELRS